MYRRKWIFLLPIVVIILRVDYAFGYFRIKIPPGETTKSFRVATFNAHDFKEIDYPHPYIQDDAWEKLILKIQQPWIFHHPRDPQRSGIDAAGA